MNKIKYLREKLGFSQMELAAKMNVSQQSIAKWENGSNMPRSDKLPELAKALECEVSDLFE